MQFHLNATPREARWTKMPQHLQKNRFRDDKKNAPNNRGVLFNPYGLLAAATAVVLTATAGVSAPAAAAAEYEY